MKIHKLRIAFVQLETAIRLFLDDKNYVCAITLAGAAEEILGTYTKKLTNENAYSLLCNDLHKTFNGKFTKDEVGKKFINFSRNELKHFNIPEHEEVEIDLEFEAISFILRASYNITSHKFMTEGIKNFNKWVSENRPDLVN
jgi:hypothetical protein